MRTPLLSAVAGIVIGVVSTLFVLQLDRDPRSAHPEAAGPELNLRPDDAAIGSIRVTLDTSTVNGAGTDNPIWIWFDNRGQPISTEPSEAFAPGASVSATLSGSSVPATLGALRRASIVLTMQLSRATIAASWHCAHARLEVRLEGSESYEPYLEDAGVGWLSQDEPPRRSAAYALQ